MNMPSPGELFENYKIEKHLGEGGMGAVLLAEDIKLGRKVALKFLTITDKKQKDNLLRRFENEARILASLNHPNIVNIFNFGTYVKSSFLVMEYVEGNTLKDVIEKRAFGVRDSVDVIRQVAEGIDEAHRNGILHRDIKPANLLINKRNTIKIVDFGISKNLMDDDSDLTQADHFIGTISYMAPEMLVGHPPAPTTDLFSVGVVFYELLTGRNPFKGSNKFETMERIRKCAVEFSTEQQTIIPDDIIKIVKKLMAKDKNDRYQSAMDVVEDIKKINYDALPDFMGVSIKPELVIMNEEKCRLKLLAKGYKETETDIIVKMAANLQELNDSSPPINSDETTVISAYEKKSELEISQEALKAAVESYEDSKKEDLNVEKNKVEFKSLHEAVLESSEHQTNLNQQAEAIPYPIKRPSILLKLILPVVLVAASAIFYPIINGEEPVYLNRVLEALTDKAPKDFNNEVALKKVVGSTKRAVSSIEKFPLKAPDAGTSYRFQETLVNNKTGHLEKNEVSLLKIKKIRRNDYFAAEKNEKTGRWTKLVLPYSAILPPISLSQRGRKDTTKYTGDYQKFYPMSVSNTVNFSFTTFRKNGNFKQYKRGCTVKEKTRETLAKKTWDVLKIECQTTNDRSRRIETLYYSPELRMVIKEEEKIEVGAHEKTRSRFLKEIVTP